MSQPEPRQALELDELLDPTRLAAAWQIAHQVAEPAPLSGAPPDPEGYSPAIADAGTDPDKGEDDPPPLRSVTATPTPLAVPQAHLELLDELERTLTSCPALGDPARHVLTVPLAQLATALAALDVAAAEAAIDALEELLQSLLATAGWPIHEEE